jgi:predicted cupin superfamily sugar epimerase
MKAIEADIAPDSRRSPQPRYRRIVPDSAKLTPSGPFLADPAALGMTAHPEGGWFRETWRHDQNLKTPNGPRSLATAIAFLLLPGEHSAWHRVTSDELWLWQGGGSVRLSLGGTGERPTLGGAHVELGPGGQGLVPANVWQTAEPAQDRATLVACIVSPGFDFVDFQLDTKR